MTHVCASAIVGTIACFVILTSVPSLPWHTQFSLVYAIVSSCRAFAYDGLRGTLEIDEHSLKKKERKKERDEFNCGDRTSSLSRAITCKPGSRRSSTRLLTWADVEISSSYPRTRRNSRVDRESLSPPSHAAAKLAASLSNIAGSAPIMFISSVR